MTIVSPDAITRGGQFEGYSLTSWLDGKDCSIKFQNKIDPRSRSVDLTLIKGLLYTAPLIPVPKQIGDDERMQTELVQEVAAEIPGPVAPSDDDVIQDVHALSEDKLRILWHQRLGHMHSR